MPGKYWTHKVYYSEDPDATTPVWTFLGEMHQDSDHSPEAATEEPSSGRELYAGTDDPYDLHIYPETGSTLYDDLRAIMLAGGDVALKFVDKNDDTEANAVIEKGFSVIVTDPKTFEARSRKRFVARFKRTFI